MIRRKHLHSTLTIMTLATLALTQSAMALPQQHQGGEMAKKAPTKKATRLGLEGYCPVCIIAAKKWEKGKKEFASTYDGVAYYFPNKAIQAKFDAAPEKYVPALNGDCIACYEKFGKRVPGNIRHAALHKDRLYLFPSDKELAVFKADPRAYEKSDLAAKGECIVCLKKGKHVPGKAEHTVIHDGLRYLFPSNREAATFRKTPATFTMAASRSKAMQKTTQHSATGSIRVVGRSACAGCEFGVTPLADPDELGLALVGADGQITVVEDAHQKYPEIYAARFEGKQLSVEGKVLKTAGKVSWIKPTSLEVVN